MLLWYINLKKNIWAGSAAQKGIPLGKREGYARSPEQWLQQRAIGVKQLEAL
jgi:hypothetical protein